MNKKLEDLDDEELNVAVALHVAGIKYRKERRAIWAETGCHAFMTEESEEVLVPERVPYATSADAVLPLLEKWASEAEFNGPGIHMTPDSRWLVSLHNADDIVASATARTLPRAICIAMLQAKGIEVIIT